MYVHILHPHKNIKVLLLLNVMWKFTWFLYIYIYSVFDWCRTYIIARYRLW